MRQSPEAREALNREQRALLDRGGLTPEERIRFDEDRAWAMYAAEKRRECQQQRALPEAA